MDCTTGDCSADWGVYYNSFLCSSASCTSTLRGNGCLCQQQRAVTCIDLSDVSDKASLESAGWTLDLSNADSAGMCAAGEHLCDLCGGGTNWFGYSHWEDEGTLTSPPLVGTGTATIEFGNCYESVSLIFVVWNATCLKFVRGREVSTSTSTTSSLTLPNRSRCQPRLSRRPSASRMGTW